MPPTSSPPPSFLTKILHTRVCLFHIIQVAYYLLQKNSEKIKRMLHLAWPISLGETRKLQKNSDKQFREKKGGGAASGRSDLIKDSWICGQTLAPPTTKHRDKIKPRLFLPTPVQSQQLDRWNHTGKQDALWDRYCHLLT